MQETSKNGMFTCHHIDIDAVYLKHIHLEYLLD